MNWRPSNPQWSQQLNCTSEDPAMPDPSPRAVSAAESTNEKRRKIDYQGLLRKKSESKQTDAGSKVHSSWVCAVIPDCWVHMSCWSRWPGWGWAKPMWLPLLHFIKTPSYKGKWAQQAVKVSHQGLEEWLECNRRDFTQTSWHKGVLLTGRWILQGVFQMILRSPHSSLLVKPLLHENCYSSFFIFPYESLICDLTWLQQVMQTKGLVQEGERIHSSSLSTRGGDVETDSSAREVNRRLFVHTNGLELQSSWGV